MNVKLHKNFIFIRYTLENAKQSENRNSSKPPGPIIYVVKVSGIRNIRRSKQCVSHGRSIRILGSRTRFQFLWHRTVRDNIADQNGLSAPKDFEHTLTRIYGQNGLLHRTRKFEEKKIIIIILSSSPRVVLTHCSAYRRAGFSSTNLPISH